MEDEHRREKDRGGKKKRSHRDDDEHDRRDRDKSSRRRKHRHRHHHDEDASDASDASSSSLTSSDERRSKKRRKSDDDVDRRRKKKDRCREEKRGKKERKRDKKRKKNKKKRKQRRSSKHGRSRSRSSSRRGSSSRSDSPVPARQQDDPSRRNHEFATALQTLLSTHPKLSTELPYILIRMAGGTTFNLSSMSDPSAARGLAVVFSTLGQFGVKLDDTGSWMWDDGSGGNGGASSRRPATELILIKLARSLLDGIGITADAASGYEERKRREQEDAAVAAAEEERMRRIEEAEREARHRMAATAESASASAKPAVEERDDESADRARSATRSLLAKFEKKAGNDVDEKGDASAAAASSSSLPSELGGIANLILEGESIVLDGIPDDDLRSDLEQLFTSLGLVKAEIEENSDDEDDDEEDEAPAMGFVLPDDGTAADSSVRTNVLAVLDECRGIQSGRGPGGKQSDGMAKKRVLGPAMGPPPGFSASQALQEYAAAPAPDDTDDEDEGPAPIGSEIARKRQRIGQSISADAVRAMAEHRQLELADVAAGGDGIPSAAVAGGREEWMLTPGKHDFLKGIKSADPCKNRKFKNEKARGGGRNAGGSDTGPQLTPQLQAEMEAIRKRVDEARGPTLIDQHRHKKAEEKEAARQSGKDKDFNWNRDRDLDAGRRVDKDHLHMVLGGAKEGLKDKFQGSFSREFM